MGVLDLLARLMWI